MMSLSKHASLPSFRRSEIVASCLVVLVLTIFFTFSPLLAADPPLSARFYFPDIPYAAVSGTDAVTLNPAALLINKPVGVHFYHSFEEGDFSGDNALLVSSSGVGFAYQRFGLGFPDGVSRYDFAFASSIYKNLCSGISYTYYKTDFKPLDKVHAWNFSLLYHINRQASLSAQFLNLNRHRFGGERSAVGYLLSAAFRPVGERLTLGGNFEIYDGQDMQDANWQLSGRAYLTDALALYGSWGNDSRVGVGIELHFGQSFAGGESFFDDEGYHRSTVYVGNSVAQRESLLRGKGKILHLPITGTIPEERQRPFFFSNGRETLYQKLAKIAASKDDPQIKGILLTISSPRIGWAKLTDIRESLLDFKSSGKPVICYLGTFSGNGSYYLATAADTILMAPVDALWLSGLRAEVQFVKGALDKLDITTEIEKIGNYKTAPNRYSESSLTPTHREAVESLLDDFYDHLISEIAAGRDLSRTLVDSLVNIGPFSTLEAESLGLTDGRIYPGELIERLPCLFGGNYQLLSSSRYRKNPRYRERFDKPDLIAIIPVEGKITRGSSGSGLYSGKKAGATTVSAMIRAATKSSRVKAIVLRLNTPGGDAVASDLIWGELSSAREQKPVVVSMSDQCTSGGYYIASAADAIVVEETTVTGSIGVYAGKANIEGFYNKLGISHETIKRGENSTIRSWTNPYTDSERAVVKGFVEGLYGNFLSVVSDGRGLSTDSVDRIAQGRVWSGRKALENGLADQEGTILDAVALAAEKAGLTTGDYQVVELSGRRKFAAKLRFLVSAAELLTGSAGESPLSLIDLSLPQELDTAPQFKMPYSIRIE